MSNDPDAPRTNRKRDDDHDARLDIDPDHPLGEAYVQFEADTSQAFRDLVQQSLARSDFIETEWVGEILTVTEV